MALSTCSRAVSYIAFQLDLPLDPVEAKLEMYRSQLLILQDTWRCERPACQREKQGYCYRHPSTGEHKSLSLIMLAQWAEDIVRYFGRQVLLLTCSLHRHLGIQQRKNLRIAPHSTFPIHLDPEAVHRLHGPTLRQLHRPQLLHSKISAQHLQPPWLL